MTSTCSLSVQKSSDERSKSCDTACSSNSSCFLKKRKPVHPLAASIRCSVSHTNSKNSTVKQRVLSAKLIKLRNLQSQINDASYHLQELQRENQTLRHLNLRQGKELSKIDGKAAELPRLIQNHNDDVRVLREKNKTLRKTLDELTKILKIRDDEILQMKKRLDELTKLNQSKHLGERKKLSDEVEDLKVKLMSAENEISTLNRRLLLEIKSSKQKLTSENVKHKECQKNLAQALAEIERLTGLVDVNCVNSKKKDVKLPLRKKISTHSRSMIALDEKLEAKTSEESILTPVHPPNGFVEKLKPILTNITKFEENGFLDVNGEIISPTDSVKARLSAGKQRTECEKPIKPPITHKLERVNSTIETKIQISKENGLVQFNKTIGDYCNKVMNTVKNCNKIVETHQESLDQSKTDTEIIKDAVEEVKALDDQLKKNSIFSLDETELKKLLKPEKIIDKRSINRRETINGHVDRKLREDPKAKLLATLRAIDKGEFIDNFDNDNTNNEICD